VLEDPAALELAKRRTPVGVLHRRDPALLTAAVLAAGEWVRPAQAPESPG